MTKELAERVLAEYFELQSKERLTVSEAKRLCKLKAEIGKAVKWPSQQYETRYGT